MRGLDTGRGRIIRLQIPHFARWTSAAAGFTQALCSLTQTIADAILERCTMHIATKTEGRSQKGAKVLALACFAIAAGLLIASLFVPSPARAGKAGHPPVQTVMR
jgi:hypothetical protein